MPAGVLGGVFLAGRDDGDDVDQYAVGGGDDEVALAEVLRTQGQYFGKAGLRHEPLVLGVHVVDLEVQQQAAPERGPVALGDGRVGVVQEGQLVLRGMGRRRLTYQSASKVTSNPR